MTVSPADARAIVERVCTRPDVLGALARRDLGMVITALGGSGITQGRISELTGVPQGRLSEWKTGKRQPKGASTFEKFASGLGAATGRAARARTRRNGSSTGTGGVLHPDRCVLSGHVGASRGEPLGPVDYRPWRP